MKTLTLEQMQLAGGNCKNVWRTLGVTIPSSMVGWFDCRSDRTRGRYGRDRRGDRMGLSAMRSRRHRRACDVQVCLKLTSFVIRNSKLNGD